ncbi:hypothetical protein PGT21_007661 [Puccinia graminis f. sp. tritici]|nr:hypothetical protein PGT21_007661 [Puccinia graminis f. sp. tritici]KAA1124939.1 hypothetical protein PGTUg99_037003 [Puccinia graminis f. sp. tritici]
MQSLTFLALLLSASTRTASVGPQQEQESLTKEPTFFDMLARWNGDGYSGGYVGGGYRGGAFGQTTFVDTHLTPSSPAVAATEKSPIPRSSK